MLFRSTCAAEFEAATPYYYSTYESPFTQLATGESPVGSGASSASANIAKKNTNTPPGGPRNSLGANQVLDDEIRVTPKKKIVILGGGPNRIGQGIEFDYCCVQAAYAARELGFEAVMVNSNPEIGRAHV